MMILKQYIIPISFLLALGVGWVTLNNYKNNIVEETIKGIEVETFKKNEEIRKNTKDAVEQNNPTSDPHISLEQLHKRQSSH